MVSTQETLKGTKEIICFYPTNQNTLHLLCLIYSDNEIKTVQARPAISTLIGWVNSSRLFSSLSGLCGLYLLLGDGVRMTLALLTGVNKVRRGVGDDKGIFLGEEKSSWGDV